MATIDDFHEEDILILTGRATSPRRHFESLRCMVATVSREDKRDPNDIIPPCIKVWPLDPAFESVVDDDGRTDDSGKFWFPVANIEKVEFVKDQEEEPVI